MEIIVKKVPPAMRQAPAHSVKGDIIYHQKNALGAKYQALIIVKIVMQMIQQNVQYVMMDFT